MARGCKSKAQQCRAASASNRDVVNILAWLRVPCTAKFSRFRDGDFFLLRLSIALLGIGWHPDMRVRPRYSTLIAVVVFSLFLGGCAKPVVEYAEPGAGQHYVARKDLKDIKLPPAPTTKAWLHGAALQRVTEPVRHSVHRLCLQLKMESARCERVLTTKVEFLADDPEPNAFADGFNNKIVVLGGVMEELGTDAEVAALVAHEMAHIVFEHHRKMHWNRSLGGIVGIGLATVHAGVTGTLDTNWVRQGAWVGRRVHSPEMEIEADRMAVYVMHDLSYPLTSSRDLIVRFYRASRDKSRRNFKKTGRWQTHPSDDRRYAHIMQAVVDVQAGVPIAESGICRECGK